MSLPLPSSNENAIPLAIGFCMGLMLRLRRQIPVPPEDITYALDLLNRAASNFYQDDTDEQPA